MKPEQQMQGTYQPKTISSTPIAAGYKDIQLPKNRNVDEIRHSKKTKVKQNKGLKKFKDLFEKILKLKEIFDTKNQKNISNEELDQLRETLHKIKYLKNIFTTEMIKYRLNTERKKKSKSKQIRKGTGSTESYQQQKSTIDQKTRHGSTERPRPQVYVKRKKKYSKGKSEGKCHFLFRFFAVGE